MSLPPVNYETIKYNDEFQAYLFDNRRDLYIALWAAKFDISGVPPGQQKRICSIYKQFIEAKENWFPAKRASKNKTPIPTRDEIRKWVELRIDIFGEKGKTMYHAGTMPGNKVCFRNSREDIIKKSAEKLTLVLEKISKKFPTMINILLHNMSARFVITPGGGDIVMNKSGGAAGSHAQARGRHWLLLKEDDLFNTEEAGESTIMKEIFHLIDYSAVNTSVGEIETCRQDIIAYSGILDNRLNGKLTQMAKNSEKDIKRFCDETDSFISAYVDVYAVDFKTDIKILARKNKIWMPIYTQLVEFPDGTAQICVTGINFEMSVREVLAKGLDAYFHNKEKLKEYNPELYDIIEKEVIPDLR